MTEIVCPECGYWVNVIRTGPSNAIRAGAPEQSGSPRSL
jgi:hypothetical protein